MTPMAGPRDTQSSLRAQKLGPAPKELLYKSDTQEQPALCPASEEGVHKLIAANGAQRAELLRAQGRKSWPRANTSPHSLQELIYREGANRPMEICKTRAIDKEIRRE